MKIDLDTQIFPQFKLSTHQDLILYLIKNELLGTRFINQLASVGFDTSFFSVELGMAILSLMGFKNRTDALWEWYHGTVDAYAAKVCLEDHAATRAVSFDFYIALRIKLHTEQG
ncbi:hypothetical protein ATE84_0903 [Aquimarina sp. MAR_2010_214]|uniref:hypothetical protein n=1 Tax=Aquimarina sp. MAR_2010_214 TaxID=1250026 RepID=UPI000C700FCE|nr:hypothetical protein [Aquimarina sp. MAR_2010_214]PKV48887.1 hypothetical protein ATE84_0903 [Aquimarina sp. MAR_2010_214]